MPIDAVVYVPAVLITIGAKVWGVTRKERRDEEKRRRAKPIEAV